MAGETFKKVYPKSLNSDGRGIFANLSMLIFGLGFLATLAWGMWLTATGHSLLFSLSVFGMAATALSTYLVSLFVTGDQANFRTRHPYWSTAFVLFTMALTLTTMAALMVLGAPTGGAFFGALAVGGVNGYAWYRSSSSAEQFNKPMVHTDQGFHSELYRAVDRGDNTLTFNEFNAYAEQINSGKTTLEELKHQIAKEREEAKSGFLAARERTQREGGARPRREANNTSSAESSSLLTQERETDASSESQHTSGPGMHHGSSEHES